ncbi:hypothetical protein Y032_0353g3286 [Ancylostoma ceylanicum]|uniref:Protein-lysine N-methyltransferase Y032_0353g3286 n=2 Tax=Ancylostoma ceylanicum TaxID=53326 RepID=A0A016RWC1_9BILA|nr:hypothetical protein Y032_0353g3286 [Ancylostoma ceylanicum]
MRSSWDSRYEVELQNFEECGDEGEIWFGRSAEKRIIDFATSNIPTSANILDLGCGNGSVLRRLRSRGYSRLTGVDYCPAAIELARRASEDENHKATITFEVMDVLSPSSRGFLANQYDVVLDKGTWDAMSLSNDREDRLTAYRGAVVEALCSSGLFVIFSCNFTREELCKFFEAGSSLAFHCEIPATHAITFGGRQGVTSTGVVFKKL